MSSYTYSCYMDEIDEIDENILFEGLLGYGLFTDKIPPFLTSKPFYDWCITVKNDDLFKEEKKKKGENTSSRYKATDYIRYTNIPRYFAIPNPIAYRNLCKQLSDNWLKLQSHFKINTKDQKHKISRLHIRNFRGKYLFRVVLGCQKRTKYQ